jgi:hypothetical protein
MWIHDLLLIRPAQVCRCNFFATIENPGFSNRYERLQNQVVKLIDTPPRSSPETRNSISFSAASDVPRL